MEVGRVDSSALATAIELKVEPRPKEKVGVITGASSDIGRATAQAFTRYGAALVLAARRQKPLEQAVNECRTRGAKAITVPLDVRNLDEVDGLAQEAVRSFGQIDG